MFSNPITYYVLFIIILFSNSTQKIHTLQLLTLNIWSDFFSPLHLPIYFVFFVKIRLHANIRYYLFSIIYIFYHNIARMRFLGEVEKGRVAKKPQIRKI